MMLWLLGLMEVTGLLHQQLRLTQGREIDAEDEDTILNTLTRILFLRLTFRGVQRAEFCPTNASI
jgi:hypothetical protein